VLWFEDLVREPVSTLLSCLGPGFLDEAAIARAMGRDAQDGTSVAREALAGATVDEGFAGAFVSAWRQARAGAQWSGETENLLRRMLA
jgi:hypothetical protein